MPHHAFPPSDAPAARRALALMFMLNGFAMGAWAPQIPALLPRHGISEGVLGLLILALGVGAVSSMLFTGRLIARHGSIALLRITALLLVPALPLVVLAPSLWLLAPAMVFFGAMAGAMDVAMNADAVEVEHRLGRAIMSSSHGFWSLGGFLGATGGAWLMARTTPVTEALAAAAVMLVLFVLALPRLRGEPPIPVAAGAAGAKPGLPRDPAIWILGVMAFFCMVPEGAVLDWAALHLEREMGADTFTSGLAFACFAGTMALTRFAGDGLRNRFGAVRVLRISGVIAAIGMMLGALAPVAPLAIAGFALAGFGVANMVPVLFSAAGNFPGASAGVAISVVTMIGYAGILVAPASIGWIAEHAGFRVTFAALSLLLLVVTALASRAALADRRQ